MAQLRTFHSNATTEALATSSAPMFMQTDVRALRLSADAALMSHVTRDGRRDPDTRRTSAIHPLQTYVMRNNSCLHERERGESTIYAVSSLPIRADNDAYFDELAPAFRTKQVRDGSILGYLITQGASDTPLLKIHFHGNTSSFFDRTFKALFRSPILKWDVENYGLYSDAPNGTPLGTITDMYPDHRVFTAAGEMRGMPRLEMQSSNSFDSVGPRHLLAVTHVPQPIGQVDSSVVRTTAPRNDMYQLALRNCTREEAVLWLSLLVATDMKRRKSHNTQVGRAPLLSPAFF